MSRAEGVWGEAQIANYLRRRPITNFDFHNVFVYLLINNFFLNSTDVSLPYAKRYHKLHNNIV